MKQVRTTKRSNINMSPEAYAASLARSDAAYAAREAHFAAQAKAKADAKAAEEAALDALPLSPEAQMLAAMIADYRAANPNA